MGYVISRTGFESVIEKLGQQYRLYAPVRKVGEGRYTDVDVVRYDFVTKFEEIELEAKSDYAFKELLTPLSQTLFFFTENEVKEADFDDRDVIIFLRSCDMHAVKRLDAIYLENKFADPFYERIRKRVKFALIGCAHSYEDCFCVDMGTNRTTEGYLFSIDVAGDEIKSDVACPDVAALFEAADAKAEEVVPAYVTENEVRVTVPEKVPNEIYKHGMWDEYTARCINCGRCMKGCPARLMPNKLADFAKYGDAASFEEYDGLECVNCGSCSFSCPAKRSLAGEINTMRQQILAAKKKK